MQRFVSDAHLLLANALHPDILPLMAARGYGQPMIEARLAEVEALGNLLSSKGWHIGNRMAASATLKEARAALHLPYMEQVGLARIALKADLSAMVGLGLQERRALSYAGYISQGLLFCNNLLGNDAWLAAIAAMGVHAADVTALRAGFEQLSSLTEALGQKAGEAVQSTAQRHTAYLALKPWIADFRKVARIALRPYPQMCERLGIRQKS